jgi:hypothetical protein
VKRPKTCHLGIISNEQDKPKKGFEMPPKNSMEILNMPSLSLGFKFEEYIPEITQNMNTIHAIEHSEMHNVKEKSKVNMFLSGSSGEVAKVESSFSSPIGSFAFTSKNSESKALKKEIKGPQLRYIKIQKKSGHKTHEEIIGDSIEESKFNFQESSSFKPENIRGDAINSILSSDNAPLFSTFNSDANISGTNFHFLKQFI